MIGKILNNRYKIEEKVGGGGMANVYKGHDNRLGREVAIKILKQDFVDDKDIVENFRKESYSAAKLNHPNIVGVFDVGNDVIDGEEIYYIVMEIVKGKTLKDLIDEKGRLSVAETLNYVIQIAEAILCAHGNNIIHRDIKPQNIIINSDNVPKVTDFGIAQGINKNTTTEHDIIGSVHYFSPEQARGEGTDERSDIYSLGILIYEMLTGQLPFDGENPISVALKQVHEPIDLASRINPEVPTQLDNIIMKMTKKDPEDRYSSLVEVIKDLKELEKKNDMDISDTLIIPSVNRERKKDPEMVDKQRKSRRSGISSNGNRNNNYNQKERRKKKKGGGILPVIGGILLALVVATAGFYFVINYVMSGGLTTSAEVEVPDLLGMEEVVARKTVEDLDLKFEVTDQLINHDYGPGEVIYQNVDPGTKVKEGYTIRVAINDLDNGTIEVSNYLGLEEDDAIDMIVDDGLDYRVNYEDVEDEDDFGIVLRQDIKAGINVEEGTSIVITVGREKTTKTVKMPNLLGQNIEDAKKILKDNNLELGEILTAESSRFDIDDVIGQSVEAGEEIEEETKIDLTKNVEPEPEPEVDEEEPEDTDSDDESGSSEERPERHERPENPEPEDDNGSTGSTTVPTDPGTPYTINYSLSVDSGDTNVTIKKIEDGEESQVYSGNHDGEEGSISVTVRGKEGAVYHIYEDGVLKDTRSQ